MDQQYLISRNTDTKLWLEAEEEEETKKVEERKKKQKKLEEELAKQRKSHTPNIVVGTLSVCVVHNLGHCHATAG
jgi:hypothetical protein